MRYATRCIDAKTCLCALMITVPAIGMLANADAVLAQTAGEDNEDSAQPSIRSAIRTFRGQAESKPALDAFYAARNYRPAWTGSQEAMQRAVQLQTLLKHADAHGLDPAAYRLT